MSAAVLLKLLTKNKMKSLTEKQSSAIIVHKQKRTATNTRTIHTRQNKPYRLGAAPAGVVGARSRCCQAAKVPAVQRHELAKSIHATFLYPTARLPPLFRCSCQRCKKDKQSPKLFSSDNNMDPGSVPVQQQMHDQIDCKKESYRLSSTCGGPRNHTNVPPVDAHVRRQLHLSAVARCSDSYCIFYFLLRYFYAPESLKPVS